MLTLMVILLYELSQVFENLSFVKAQKVLKFEFYCRSDYYMCKENKKGIGWYIHFIGKPVISTVIILPRCLS